MTKGRFRWGGAERPLASFLSLPIVAPTAKTWQGNLGGALKTGYPSDRFEADGQRLFWGPAVLDQAGQFWLGRPNFYTAQYAYAKYHTLLATLEIGWEESGVARVRGLLQIGKGP
jgi:hypothetical protein